MDKTKQKQNNIQDKKAKAPRHKLFVIPFWLSIIFIVTVLLLEKFGISFGK